MKIGSQIMLIWVQLIKAWRFLYLWDDTQSMSFKTSLLGLKTIYNSLLICFDIKLINNKNAAVLNKVQDALKC